MSKDTYNKARKASWCQGKRYKGDSEERQRSKREVEEEFKQDNDNYLTKYRKKKKPNLEAKLKYRIEWYTQKMTELANQGRTSYSWNGYLVDGLKRAQKEYKEKFGDKT